MWRKVTRGLVLSLFLFGLASVSYAQTEFHAFLERPLPNETVSGIVNVQGWAVDPVGISRVDVILDGQFLHSANLNLPRIDVLEIYPDWDGYQNRFPGFATGFTANRFSDGAHTLMVRIFTEDNEVFEIGERTINIDNSINQAPHGYVDQPDSGRAVWDVHGSFPVTGWVIDTDGIARVDVLIDNLEYQSAVYGDPRPDVGNAFPDLPSALFSAFIAHVDTTRMLPGVHSLVVRATDHKGATRTVGRRTIQVFNSVNNLRPFGYLDQPQRDAVLYGTCNLAPPPVSPVIDVSNVITPVRGWALDLGARSDLGRVAYAELLIDGVEWYTTDDCRFDPTFEAFVDCYGLTRFDVAKYYPTYPDAPRSGFFFAIDVGSLMKLGVRAGHHVMKVRVGDQEQTFADLPHTSGVPVFFACVENNFFNPIGYIDYPTNYDYLKGAVTFYGWTIDDASTVAAVEIWIDGTFAGVAQYGFPRTDVQAAYPVFRNSRNSGWRFTMDTTQLSDARHRLTVVAVDSQNQRSEIGSVDFYVDNP